MRAAIVVLIAVASMALGLHAAEATTDLLHPASIHLVRGHSSQSSSAAVPAVQTQGDASFYDVSSRRVNGVNTVLYTFIVNNATSPATSLTDDWNGQVTAPCKLKLALWNFRSKRWVGRSFGSISPSPTTVFAFVPEGINRFIRGTTIRGRVACTSRRSRFVFSTDRIRLPEDH